MYLHLNEISNLTCQNRILLQRVAPNLTGLSSGQTF